MTRDARITSALANWAPRFTTNGVIVSDFQEVTGPLEHWGQWCSAWSGAAAGHERLGRDALSEGRTRSAGEHLARAALYYHFGKFLYFEDRDEARDAHRAAVRCLNDALPHLDPPGRRIEIPYQGATLVGVLRLPAGPGPHPAVLMIPGLDSAKEEFRTTERTFLDRGLATFSVDGPGQGEAEYDLPITAAWEDPGRALIDVLAAQPGVDAGRIAVWGSASAATTPHGWPQATTGCAPAWRSPAPTTSEPPGISCHPSPVPPSVTAPTRRTSPPRPGPPVPSPCPAVRSRSPAPSWSSPANATASSPGRTPAASSRSPPATPNSSRWTRATTAARTCPPTTARTRRTGSRRAGFSGSRRSEIFSVPSGHPSLVPQP